MQQTAEALKATTEANAATLKTLTRARSTSARRVGLALASVVAAAPRSQILQRRPLRTRWPGRQAAVFLVEDRLIAEGDAHYTVVKQRLDLFKDMILSATSGLSGRAGKGNGRT
ncbi:MAG: hypothetical protein U0531_06200 [Dehalococcoidia bacterium]